MCRQGEPLERVNIATYLENFKERLPLQNDRLSIMKIVSQKFQREIAFEIR